MGKWGDRETLACTYHTAHPCYALSAFLASPVHSGRAAKPGRPGLPSCLSTQVLSFGVSTGVYQLLPKTRRGPNRTGKGHKTLQEAGGRLQRVRAPEGLLPASQHLPPEARAEAGTLPPAAEPPVCSLRPWAPGLCRLPR